jgi:hypothetical protein
VIVDGCEPPGSKAAKYYLARGNVLKTLFQLALVTLALPIDLCAASPRPSLPPAHPRHRQPHHTHFLGRLRGYPACGFGILTLSYGIFGGPLLAPESARLNDLRCTPQLHPPFSNFV